MHSLKFEKISTFEKFLYLKYNYCKEIRQDFIYLTEVILQKPLKFINKQLQDTLMNYFLENHVGDILQKQMKFASNR